jgi:hypothetical protein
VSATSGAGSVPPEFTNRTLSPIVSVGVPAPLTLSPVPVPLRPTSMCSPECAFVALLDNSISMPSPHLHKDRKDFHLGLKLKDEKLKTNTLVLDTGPLLVGQKKTMQCV